MIKPLILRSWEGRVKVVNFKGEVVDGTYKIEITLSNFDKPMDFNRLEIDFSRSFEETIAFPSRTAMKIDADGALHFQETSFFTRLRYALYMLLGKHIV